MVQTHMRVVVLTICWGRGTSGSGPVGLRGKAAARRLADVDKRLAADVGIAVVKI